MRNDTLEDFTNADVFDVRNVIKRFETLETERENVCTGERDAEDAALLAAWDETDDGEEYADLKAFLEAMAGNGGDEQWRGDWYPVTFIRDNYFTEYAEEMTKDIGDLPANIPSYLVIDWEATADNIRQDYTSVDLRGITYWYR